MRTVSEPRVRLAAPLAWTLFATTAIMTGLSLLLITRGPAMPRAIGIPTYEVVDNLAFLLIPLVGALIASRQPHNLLGWGFLAATLAGAGGELAGWYAFHGFFGLAPLPGAAEAAWFSQWVWILPVGGLPVLFLLFPDGRLPSGRWRWLATAVPFPFILMTPVAVAMWHVRGTRLLLIDPDRIPYLTRVSGFFIAAIVSVLALTVSATFSLFARFRTANARQRQQIKWLAYAGVILSCEGVLSIFVFPDATVVKMIADTLAFATIPTAIGIAILRHGLYDIDVLINRTLVYGALSAMLATAYFAGVALFQAVLPLEDESSIAVAATTLAIAALFRPLRARVQGFIDRRFYRTKYDAEQTIEEFSARLRDEVDLDELTDHLLEVVQKTMQPAQVSLWLRGQEAPR